MKESERTVVIDGCFLICLKRIMKNLVDESRMFHIDALGLHKQYSDVFHMDAVPEADRARVAREVADKILTQLREEYDLAEVG